jgi:maltodextrin utilization protein YvdJ
VGADLCYAVKIHSQIKTIFMKKLFSFCMAVMSFVFITALIMNPVTAQKASGGGSPIPDSVMKIADKSCVKCHTEPGNMMAIEHLNLSNWNKFSQEKQASKAEAMCNMVTKDKMPPGKFRKEHPDGVPSSAEMKTICDWAASLQIPKK